MILGTFIPVPTAGRLVLTETGMAASGLLEGHGAGSGSTRVKKRYQNRALARGVPGTDSTMGGAPLEKNGTRKDSLV